VLIHGDASFAAQGVVAETFNLARLKGYTTGGTIHLIANNQLGFTTDPKEGRSTDYSSDLAKDSTRQSSTSTRTMRRHVWRRRGSRCCTATSSTATW